MSGIHVKSGDTVVVLSGDDKGKKGKVMDVSCKEKKLIVEGVNVVTKHVKPRKQGDPGGLIKAEAPMYASKVMVVCPKCGKPTRAASKIMEDGKKKRLCKICGATF